MNFHSLPDRRDCAFANMADDLLLLEDSSVQAIRFRHYEWQEAAFSFGYSQKYEWVRTQIAEPAQICRRPTGGGIVDHRNDWTYSLILPTDHPLYRKNPRDLYRLAHEAIASALLIQGQVTHLHDCRQNTCPPSSSSSKQPTRPTICFERPEHYDLISPQTGEKIAGAALKRTRQGLLLQGSINKACTRGIKWGAFKAQFMQNLMQHLGAPSDEIAESSFPCLPSQRQSVIARFKSDAWLKKR